MRRGRVIVFFLMLLFAAAVIGLRVFDSLNGPVLDDSSIQSVSPSETLGVSPPGDLLSAEDFAEDYPEEIDTFVEQPGGEDLIDESDDYSPIVGDYVLVLQDDEEIHMD